MNPVLRKLQVSVTQQALVLNQAFTSCRATPSIRHPVWCTASANERLYRSMPTHGIGRWRYLLPKQAPKKRKEKQPMKPILAATDTAYGSLNVKLSGYDMTLVEHYTQYIHNLCNRLGIRVAESYALPTKSTEVMLMQEKGTKMYVDAVLKTHERVVQVNSLNAALCPVFMEVLLKNQPEGVQLSVKELLRLCYKSADSVFSLHSQNLCSVRKQGECQHTEADYHSRFKSRPELEGLMAQINQ